MFPAVSPHFNFPIHRGVFEYFQAVKLTPHGAEHYNEQLETTCLSMGVHVGYIKWDGKDYLIFNVKYHPMGKSPSKFDASEGLLKLYVSQNRGKETHDN